MSITIGKIVSHSKGGHQYGVQIYTDSYSGPRTLKFEIAGHLNDGDYVLGELLEEESPQRLVFRYTNRFAPDDVNCWLVAYSAELENGRNLLIPDITCTYNEQLSSILRYGEESIPLVRMIMEDGCNHIDSLSDTERRLIEISYRTLCDYLPIIKDKPKQLGMFIILCVRLINNAWNKEWFSSEKDSLLNAHMLDELIYSIKNTIQGIGLQEDDSMAVFYSRRINAIAASNGAECSLKVFITQTHTCPYDYVKYLSSDAKRLIDSIYHHNGPTIPERIKSRCLEEVKQYFTNHQDEWQSYGTDLVQRLNRESPASRIDFIRTTYSHANKSIREAYLNLLLRTEIATVPFDDYMAILQNLYSDDLKLDVDVNETRAKAICRYFCDNAAKHVDSRISHLALKVWKFVKWRDLSFDEQVDYLKCGLLNISSVLGTSDINLFTLWQSCRSKDVGSLLEDLNKALREREDRWTDWDLGIELYEADIFRHIPFHLLFRPGTSIDTIASELLKLKPAYYIEYLESYPERKLATDVAALLWSKVLKTVKFSHCAVSTDTEVYQSRYSSMPDDEVFIGLLKDWSGHERKALKAFIASVLRDSIDKSITKSIKALFKQDKYVSHSDVEWFICEHRRYFDNLLIAQRIGLSELITDTPTVDICKDLPGLKRHKEDSNRKFFKLHLSDPLKVRGHVLIEEQKRAVICDEDNTLVVNSAGGGKSTLIEAKARYLINTQNITPKDILILSFNHSVAEELASKMKDVGVECGTFHAIAQGILNRHYGYNPSFFEQKDGLAIYFDLISTDPQFKRTVTDYAISTSYDGLKAPYEYNSAEEYTAAVIEHNSKRRGKCPEKLFPEYKDMDGRTVPCKSNQECKICDFLGSHGIAFKYESFYEHDIQSADRRRYQPDFAIYRKKSDEKPLLYIEHIGINRDGKCAPWINQEAYEEKRAWAQGIHNQFNTILLETTGAEFDDHSVFTNLAQKLEEYGIDLSNTVAPPYNNYDYYSYIGRFCVSYVSLLKSSCQSFEDIRKKVKSKDDLYFLDKMIGRYLEEYERVKKGNDDKKDNGRVDFDDAILEATELLNDGIEQQTYKYILIDEFQDISIARHRFVRALRNSDTKLFCVGDDWQSIYRFAGSDLSLFANFEQYTGYSAKIEAGTTFRFGNPAREVSSRFISQSKPCDKRVKQHDKDKVTEIETLPYEMDPVSQIQAILDDVLVEDSSNGKDKKIIPKVIFLARNSPKNDAAFKYLYNPSLKITNKNTERGEKYFVSYKGQEIPFYSIHAAKGLEAENVIVLNCNDGKFGIPSQMSESPLLRYVLSKPDAYPYAEERRIFYVALTRATTKTWLLYQKNHPSPFVTEIQKILQDISIP